VCHISSSCSDQTPHQGQSGQSGQSFRTSEPACNRELFFQKLLRYSIPPRCLGSRAVLQRANSSVYQRPSSAGDLTVSAFSGGGVMKFPYSVEMSNTPGLVYGSLLSDGCIPYCKAIQPTGQEGNIE